MSVRAFGLGPAPKLALALTLGAAACSTAGTRWMEEPLTADDAPLVGPPRQAAPSEPGGAARRPPPRSVTLGSGAEEREAAERARAGETIPGGGRSLGTFRNTYYDFPSERDFSGETVTLWNRDCQAISSVPKGFYEAVCVQGSGMLRRGATVSFARRDCTCAETCPRTGQKICFDELDQRQFPWGRGAMGQAITPLVTVAVDPAVIPLGTALYVPELDGLPRDPAGTSAHDGCFVAQDKGLKVQGKHLDVFTGDHSVTTLWNRRVPSNAGVTVIVDSPRCSRAP